MVHKFGPGRAGFRRDDERVPMGFLMIYRRNEDGRWVLDFGATLIRNLQVWGALIVGLWIINLFLQVTGLIK
jgi:hypothetical protein